MTTFAVFLGIAVLENLGPLHKAFLFDQPLSPLSVELASAVTGAGLFSGTPLDELHLRLYFGRPGKPKSSLNEQGAQLGRTYVAPIQVEVSALFDKTRHFGSDQLMSDVLAVIRSLAVTATAQAASDVGVEGKRIAGFLACFPDVSTSLKPPRIPTAAAWKRPAYLLDVQITHEGGAASEVLNRQAQIREVLEDVLRERGLGQYDGGSSGELHYEFSFAVTDVEKAIALMRAALEAAGVPAERIGFEPVGERTDDWAGEMVAMGGLEPPTPAL